VSNNEMREKILKIRELLNELENDLQEIRGILRGSK